MRAPDAAKLRSCLERFTAIRMAYLYGSAVAGEEFRDVDIAVGLKDRRGRPMDSIAFRVKLATALGRPFPFEFDVHILSEMPLSLQYRIVATGRLLFCRSELEKIRYEARILNEFLDFKPAHDMLVRSTLERASRR